MTEVKRSLYQCSNAKVLGDKISCSEGYQLEKRFGGENGLNIIRLARGAPLELAICQGCPKYDEMGPPIPPEERGWL